MTLYPKTIITAHNNADFDALAAMVAASKLYPGATLVFPGSQEKTLRNFFIQSATYLFNFQNARDIDPDSVETLVLVDTRQASRLQHIHKILEKRNLVIHIYDHHPDSDEDLKAEQGLVAPWGATTSILVQQLKERELTLTPDEATILGCGIFEDTGSFTYNSTTSHDFEAAAWLRDQGMDLNVIADLLNRDLSSEQIAILNSLLEAAVAHEINGVQVVITEVTLDHYVGDFALLVHKMLDMENIRSIFALGLMQDRIHLVARSRTPDVDVGHICNSLGGGGHAFAASATIKDRTISQVKDELFALLYTHINPQLLVKDLMSKPAVTVQKSDTLREAFEVMTRFGLKTIVVVEPGGRQCAGVLDRTIADKAIAHELDQLPVREYMQRDCAVINPESDLYPVIEIIIGQRQRLVPVVQDGDVIGVITRTDLINTLIEEPARIPETLLPEKNRERSIKTLLRERLPNFHFHLLELAGNLADELGYAAYAVGGFVRDILLRRQNLDLDMVVEGDGVAFAQALSTRLNGRIRPHHKFKTAVVIFKGPKGEDQRIDVATARLEYYEYPAALPTVELSSIKMDLFRRDFTINALAVQLNRAHFGRLVDFFGAQRDIKERTLRVLHSLSFVEDPTRILRAIRFEQRFNFQLGGQTTRLIKNALNLELLQRLSGSRLFHEFKLIMDEKNPLACLRSMQRFNLLQAIHPQMHLSPNVDALLEEVEKVLNWHRLLFLEEEPRSWLIHLLGLCSGWSEEDALRLAQRLNFSKRVEKEFLTLRSLVAAANDRLLYWSKISRKLSELYAILIQLPIEGVLYVMARTQSKSVRKHISLYLTSLRNIKIELSGDDVIDLGVKPGPLVGETLWQLLAAKIDGKAPTLLSQLGAAEKIIREGAVYAEKQAPLGMGVLPMATSPEQLSELLASKGDPDSALQSAPSLKTS
jgi:tRNA nucleotidyltransferase (CCA-adding enzyme)